MFNDLPSSRRGHLLVVSFIFFCFFFLHSFVFFLPILFGVSFFFFFNFWGYLCMCTFLYFFCKNPCEIFFFLFFFFLGGVNLKVIARS